jgi:hypothetical protein
MSLKIGKLYKNITECSSWTLYSLDYQKILGYLNPGNCFVVLGFKHYPNYTWDSYEILFEDGNLYQITFKKDTHNFDILFREIMSNDKD